MHRLHNGTEVQYGCIILMPWRKIATIPDTKIEVDDDGNIHRRSIETGRFISGTVHPNYGNIGFGESIELSADLSETDE